MCIEDEYCVYNLGGPSEEVCFSCSLCNYRRDCHNNPISEDKEVKDAD